MKETKRTRSFISEYFIFVIFIALVIILACLKPSFISPRNLVNILKQASINGILAFGMMFPESRILVFFVLPVKAKYLVIGYAILELVAGLGSSADGIAHFAHLGGMIFGFLLIMYWKKKRNNGSYNY